ncbi:MAG: hypothetical protein J3Q66DRAFT_389143 [Benniella sp.]|nr:MAG: hypothetical protein J3Q66DRAFT_389143 [Benniella sp.]
MVDSNLQRGGRGVGFTLSLPVSDANPNTPGPVVQDHIPPPTLLGGAETGSGPRFGSLDIPVSTSNPSTPFPGNGGSGSGNSTAIGGSSGIDRPESKVNSTLQTILIILGVCVGALLLVRLIVTQYISHKNKRTEEKGKGKGKKGRHSSPSGTSTSTCGETGGTDSGSFGSGDASNRAPMDRSMKEVPGTCDHPRWWFGSCQVVLRRWRGLSLVTVWDHHQPIPTTRVLNPSCLSPITRSQLLCPLRVSQVKLDDGEISSLPLEKKTEPLGLP